MRIRTHLILSLPGASATPCSAGLSRQLSRRDACLHYQPRPAKILRLRGLTLSGSQLDFLFRGKRAVMNRWWFGSMRRDALGARLSRRAWPRASFAMDPKTFQVPKQATNEGKRLRRAYVDAIRDWVAKGDRREFVLAPEEARRRAVGPSTRMRSGPIFGSTVRERPRDGALILRRSAPAASGAELQASDVGDWNRRQSAAAELSPRSDWVMHYYAPLEMKGPTK